MRRLLVSSALGIVSCSGQPLTPHGMTHALPSGYENVVEAVLKEHMTDQDSYCLTIDGNPPAPALVSSLRAYGHEPRSCGGESHELDFVEIIIAENEGYSAILDETCGVLCGRKFVFDLREDAAGRPLVVGKRVELEY